MGQFLVIDGMDFTATEHVRISNIMSIVDIMLINWLRRRKGNKDISNGFITNHNYYYNSAMA